MEVKIIFEDSEILVLDKPSGITVNRAETTIGEVTVQDFVEDYLKIRSTKHEIRNKSKVSNGQNGFEFRNSDFEFVRRAGIVHRIDKETSGILLVAKKLPAFLNLQAQFKERKVRKTYLALVHGKVEPVVGEIKVPVGRLPWNRKRFGVIAEGREAATRYRVISNIKYHPFGKLRARISKNDKEILTLLELYPQTGRTHQIRVHLKSIGHPIFSDPLYGGRKTSRNDRKILPRMFLHASKISFTHPTTGDVVSFESPLPKDPQHFLNSLAVL